MSDVVYLRLGKKGSGMSYEAQRQAVKMWNVSTPVIIEKYLNLLRYKKEAGG